MKYIKKTRKKSGKGNGKKRKREPDTPLRAHHRSRRINRIRSESSPSTQEEHDEYQETMALISETTSPNDDPIYQVNPQSGGKTRRKKTRRKRRKKTRKKKKRHKKTRRKRRRKKTRRKKRGGNGDMPGIEMKQFDKTYPQNQPPTVRPTPLHQRLNKEGQKKWKTLKGFFGLTPNKEVQAKHWKKHDEEVARMLS